jgi:RNA polymerase sigma factor (sigma-70 family)
MRPANQRARRKEVNKFFDEHQGELFGFLLNTGLSEDDAEDILNESFEVIWRYWHKLRGSNPRAYLYTVARNRVKKLWGTRARKPEDLVGDSPVALTSGSAVIAVDFTQQVVDRETMNWALGKLTAREREAVLLRYDVGCDVAETAMIMGISTGTVKRYTADGLDKLYRALTGGSPNATRKERTK